MKKITVAICTLLIITCAGCYYDKEEILYPAPGACNTTNVTFGATINNLLTTYGCIGCHSGGVPSGNINLVGYSNVKSKITDGRLWGAINHLSGFSPMPQGGNKMNVCDINKIKVWIDAGAPNN
jgi:hypothetical protein